MNNNYKCILTLILVIFFTKIFFSEVDSISSSQIYNTVLLKPASKTYLINEFQDISQIKQVSLTTKKEKIKIKIPVLGLKHEPRVKSLPFTLMDFR